ncbi:MAG: aminotransferase class I/II-fold pyridoxal phosphate-dependent enzyme [Bacteroidetes bacterium]|nr:aminotransferase class I/II-fold pyridoxal phosphate-dependent enzyme [Bacteroidota bacterium]
MRKIELSFRAAGKKEGEKKYHLLFRVIKELILNGEMPDQFTLPPSRMLATSLGISRSTVIRAYETLKFETLITGKAGSGYKIKAPEIRTVKPVPPSTDNFPKLSKAGNAFYSNINLINSTEDESIAFRPGLPPLDIFPVTQWKRLSNNYWRHISLSSLSYSATAGIRALKQNIADYLSVSRGVHCSAEQVFVVSGSLQSLYIIGKAFLDPGDVAVLENPTFPNAHSIFKSMLAELAPVDVDSEGIMINSVDPQKARKAKILHVTPSCHYPTGRLMSRNRRLEVLKWARENKCLIIENDYEHEIANRRNSEPSLFTLDEDQRTIFLGTFNRLLHPSLRIGYMVVPLHLKDVLDALMRHSHRFVSPSIQVVLNHFIEKQLLWQHVNNLVEEVDARRDVFKKEFHSAFDGKLTLLEPDSPSMQLLAKIDGDIRDRDLVQTLNKHRIITHAYSKCFIGEANENGLIFGFSPARIPVIKNRIGQMNRIFTNLD